MSKFNIPSSEYSSLGLGLKLGAGKLVDAFLVCEDSKGMADSVPEYFAMEHIGSTPYAKYYIQPCKVNSCQVLGKTLFDGAYIGGKFVTTEELVKCRMYWEYLFRIDQRVTKNIQIYLNRDAAIRDIERHVGSDY